MSTKCYIFNKVINIVVLVIGALTLLMLGPNIDRMFPVVQPFNVESVKLTATTVEIHGTAVKPRDCKPLDVQVLAYDKDNKATLGSIKYLDTDTGIIPARPKSTSLQNWGPWVLDVPEDTVTVELSALHHCHILWDTRTHFVTLNLKEYK